MSDSYVTPTLLERFRAGLPWVFMLAVVANYLFDLDSVESKFDRAMEECQASIESGDFDSLPCDETRSIELRGSESRWFTRGVLGLVGLLWLAWRSCLGAYLALRSSQYPAPGWPVLTRVRVISDSQTLQGDFRFQLLSAVLASAVAVYGFYAVVW